MSTIYDVAERAGVSISTVSLALNRPGRVKPATLERILLAVDQLGYVPKSEAMARARRGLGRIGVMAPFTSYSSFALRLNGVLRAMQHEAWEVVVFDQESAGVTSPTLASVPLARRLDGLLIMSLPFDDTVAQRLLKQGLPTVLIEVQRPGFSSVTIDDFDGGHIVAEFLLRRGHQCFAFVGEQKLGQQRTLPAEARLTGFRETLEAAGCVLPDKCVRHVPHGYEHARAAANELLDLPQRPTAIFTHDDIIAAGVLRAARDRGLNIPRDLAVVGFDDSDIAEHIGLTTVRQPFEQSGEIAAQTLMTQIAQPDRSLQHVVLKLNLIERETA